MEIAVFPVMADVRGVANLPGMPLLGWLHTVKNLGRLRIAAGFVTFPDTWEDPKSATPNSRP